MKKSATGFRPLDGVTRGVFLKGAAACGAAAACGTAMADGAAEAPDPRDEFQREIDVITPGVWSDYYKRGTDIPSDEVAAMRAKYAALGRYEDAFEKVLAEVKSTEVTGRPAVWFVYNMGFIVKTPKSLFAIDLHHRRAEELAPMLDFALITHNHSDHFTDRFYNAMNGIEKKTVVSNFKDNYGAFFGKKHKGGYTRAVKTFKMDDVSVRTSYVDHNDYLLDFTTAFEITVGDFTIFHSGDCSSVGKLKCECPNPDLWMFHPYCGLDAVKGAEALKPKLAVVAHLNELGHAKDRWRWTWSDGARARKNLEAAGFAATVPLWGDRIV